MVSRIDTDEVRALMDAGAVVIEVLGRSEYDKEHLPGARHIPLSKLHADAVADIDRGTPVVVYCFDFQCDMSPRAACRLEDLGFTQVHDYVAGKAAWLAMGLPSEGTVRPEERVSALAHRRLPELALDADAGGVDLGGHEFGVVLDGAIVAGSITAARLDDAAGRPLREVLDTGVDTFRPSMTIAELCDYWAGNEEQLALVSTLRGEYLGAILRSDLDVPAR